MSSRAGPRAFGSDGSDYGHRERVADQYKISAQSKTRIKYALYLHLSMVLLMIIRLSTALFVMFGVRPPSFLQRLKLPVGRTWEFVWLLSVLPVLFGLFSLPKNRAFFMKQFLLGMMVFGLLPVFWGLYDISDDFMDYFKTKKATVKFHGFPLIILWAMFLAIAFQIHVFSMHFGRQLVNAWQARGEKKKGY